jgi:hypothetical protein
MPDLNKVVRAQRKDKIIPKQTEIDALVNAYKSGLSTTQLANTFNIPKSRARRILLESGTKLRGLSESILMVIPSRRSIKGIKKGPMTKESKALLSKRRLEWGDKNAKGTRIATNGYLIYTRGPNLMRGVHVVVMETHIGRRLHKHEVVHHIDENKLNNDLSNLQLMTRSEHTSLHRVKNPYNSHAIKNARL